MANPVLCEVTRGNLVESAHRGAVAVVDADGSTVFSIGNTDEPIYPRSAIKAIQALPLVENGAADAYGFGTKELALVCSSHSGEPAHVGLATAMLAQAGLTHEALECGPQWPSARAAASELMLSGGKPGALHNNCSGKHTGFLCGSAHLGIPHQGYVKRDHPYQRMVVATLEQVIGVPHSVDLCGVDGCSIPTHAVPLRSLASGFARMASGAGFKPERAKAAKRLFDACFAEPFFVDGTDRPCTRMLQAGCGDVFAKNGAEGVYCGAIPSLGLGIALKCDDGAMRAAGSMFAAVTAKLLSSRAELAVQFAAIARSDVLSRNKLPVGEIRPAGELTLSL